MPRLSKNRFTTGKRFRTVVALGAAALIATTGLIAPSKAAAATDPDCNLPGAVNVPNRYKVDFCVAPDQVFIFAANYKPFEYGASDNGNHQDASATFDKIIGDKLQAAFPDADIKYATWDYPVRYEDLKAAGVVPDIVLDNPRNRIDRDLEPMGWVQDLTQQIADAGIDLTKLNQGAVEQVKSRSDGGIYGVPIFVDDYMLYYNKKIFDKFGVSYPKAGMTYAQAYKKAKKLTRDDGTDHYKGYMQHPDNYVELNQLGAYPFLDTGSEEPAPEDVKVDLTSAAYQQVASTMYQFLTIPGNNFTTVDDLVKGDMSRPGHVAMAVDTLSKLPKYEGSALFTDPDDRADFAEWNKSVDLGVAPVPVLTKGSKATYQPNQTAAFVPPQSKHQDTALQMIKWLTSEDGQIALSRYALKPVLENTATEKAFGVDIPELDHVDTSAVFWGQNAVIKDYKNTEYWDIPYWEIFRQHVLKDGMSPSAALQVAEATDVPAYIKAQAAAGKDW
ncbi:extracellular solute-binding protein [Microlunatus elymi]|uniref:Extracellular solute-binding protein n=1 Tax=Microlunatus elymi TaxID=2596828 RepID=A0A516Q101_9ACTN|nr:extracellular solute-binding protein [Microlunatus elymi]QDP97097.1 extracellular solute-binding protein [Microlunatus elymi]